jgi:hypothetical protein
MPKMSGYLSHFYNIAQNCSVGEYSPNLVALPASFLSLPIIRNILKNTFKDSTEGNNFFSNTKKGRKGSIFFGMENCKKRGVGHGQGRGGVKNT